MVLVGNKGDLVEKRQVQIDVAEQQAKEYNIEHFEASAKGNSNVYNIFENLAKQVIQKKGGSEKFANNKQKGDKLINNKDKDKD